MPTFSYVARSKAGEKKQGTTEASNRLAAIKQIESQGLFPVSVREGTEPVSSPTPPTFPFQMPRHAKWIAVSIAAAFLVIVISVTIANAMGMPTYLRAKSAFDAQKFNDCISILDSGPEKLRRSASAVLLKGNAFAALINELYKSGQYARCIEMIESLCKGKNDLAPKELLEMRDTSRAILAEKKIRNCDYSGALPMLELIPSTFRQFEAVQELIKTAQFFVDIEAQFPVHSIIESKCVIISDCSRIKIGTGIVDSIDLVGKKLVLRNTMHDRVKPDLKVLVLNRDGVILLSHSENWLIDSLDFNQTHTAKITAPLCFPPSLVFSRWAVLAWDAVPKYAVAVGSKTSYDAMLNSLRNESKRLRRTPPERLGSEYVLTDLLPEAVRFAYDKPFATPGSDIVNYVTFTNGKAKISYRNKTDMRIKPRVKGFVFNADGVIIGTFEDSWLMDSLAPGEERSQDISLRFDVPDELVLSRWASAAYDMQPTHFILAGSSEQFADMSRRAEVRIGELNRSSLQ